MHTIGIRDRGMQVSQEPPFFSGTLKELHYNKSEVKTKTKLKTYDRNVRTTQADS